MQFSERSCCAPSSREGGECGRVPLYPDDRIHRTLLPGQYDTKWPDQTVSPTLHLFFLRECLPLDARGLTAFFCFGLSSHLPLLPFLPCRPPFFLCSPRHVPLWRRRHHRTPSIRPQTPLSCSRQPPTLHRTAGRHLLLRLVLALPLPIPPSLP